MASQLYYLHYGVINVSYMGNINCKGSFFVVFKNFNVKFGDSIYIIKTKVGGVMLPKFLSVHVYILILGAQGGHGGVVWCCIGNMGALGSIWIVF